MPHTSRTVNFRTSPKVTYWVVRLHACRRGTLGGLPMRDLEGHSLEVLIDGRLAVDSATARSVRALGTNS